MSAQTQNILRFVHAALKIYMERVKNGYTYNDTLDRLPDKALMNSSYEKERLQQSDHNLRNYAFFRAFDQKNEYYVLCLYLGHQNH